MPLELLSIRRDVRQAIAHKQPVVALESTIISHGMPFPNNLKTALSVEAVVRSRGALPATIAVLDGKLRVGLTEEEIGLLAKLGPEAAKVSRRDLAFVLQQHKPGATTVAASMIGAARAGIRFFATGGIGGVHKGAAQHMDISADLQELARTPVAVICAGAKAILDLELTLEYLETYGVPVIGYQTDELPAFYSRQSGLPLDIRLDTVTEVAKVAQLHWASGLDSGLIIANPIAEADEVPAAEIAPIIEMAIEEAAKKGIKGKALTPFLLAKIESLTDGRSLKANISLVHQNTRLAADLAVAYHKLL